MTEARPPRPPEMPWLLPYLTVADVEAAMEFYQRAFGLTPQGEPMRNSEGKIVHGEMKWHDAVLMFGLQGERDCPIRTPAASGVASPIGLFLYCDDVDALFERAKAAGAVVVSEPTNMFWGDRMCRLTDPDGHSWSFGTNVADFDPAQAQAVMSGSGN